MALSEWLKEAFVILIIPALLLLIFMLAGCKSVQTTPGTFCTDYHPVTVSPDDRLSDETAREILVNNRNWKKFCSK